MMDLRQSRDYARYIRRKGWVVEKVAEKKMLIRGLPLTPFRIMKCQRFVGGIDDEEVKKVKRKYRVIYSIWEPKDKSGEEYCVRKGMYKSRAPYLPSATLMVDLAKTKQGLWMDLSKNARQEIKGAKTVVVEKVKRQRQRWVFWKKWKRSGKGYVSSYKNLEDLVASFGSNAWLIGAWLGGEMVAGAVVLISEKTAYYYYSWTSGRGREKGAQYKLVWEAMMRAKREGVKKWDFEGIEDERFPKKSWKGFSLFKKKFGGTTVRFPGSYRWFF